MGFSSCCYMGLVALRHVGSSPIRDKTWVPCLGRLIFNHETTREALKAIFLNYFAFVVAQSLSHVWLFAPPWTVARQASLSSTISWSLLRFLPIESVMISNHIIICCPLLSPSVFPSLRVFSSELALRIRWPKYWSFSFSVSPSNELFRVDFL